MSIHLTTLATGSSGNCYLVNSDDETLVIEAGIPFMEVKKALNFNVKRIVGVVVSHGHGDHANYIHEYEKAGIPIWTPYKDINHSQKKSFGSFTVSCFDCIHDVACVGYLITHPDGLRLMYATDTQYVKFKFRDLTAMLIEANWSEKYVDKSEPKYRHVLQGHLSIQTALECIKANINPKLSHIILCHLSGGNAHPGEFVRAAEDVVPAGVTVDVAVSGATVDLNEIPF